MRAPPDRCARRRRGAACRRPGRSRADGVLELGKDEPVRPETPFRIASIWRLGFALYSLRRIARSTRCETASPDAPARPCRARARRPPTDTTWPSTCSAAATPGTRSGPAHRGRSPRAQTQEPCGIATLVADRGPGRTRSLARRAETAETHRGGPMTLTKEAEAGDHRQARARRGRHRLAAGADRAADRPDQRPDRAPAHAQARPLLAARTAQARRSPPPAAQLPAAHRPRGLSRPDQGARPTALGSE